MAKNKVINTVLTLKDEMSGGLVAAAKAAKKSGKNIDDSMMQATRKVVAFKNKLLTALGDFAKKGVKAAGAAVAGMTAAFIALDGATEEYRVAQGKLIAGFQAAGLSADTARKSYRNFYAILGGHRNRSLAAARQHGEERGRGNQVDAHRRRRAWHVWRFAAD